MVIGSHFGGEDHFDGGDHFGGGTRHETFPLFSDWTKHYMIRYRLERNVPTTHDLCDLSENAENKGFFLVENEQHLSEVRMRKLTERINPIKTI